MSNILLTGANGFIGKYVHKKLVEAGFFVIPIDIVPGNTDDMIVADISKKDCVQEIAHRLENTDISGIVHLAASIDFNNPQGLIEANCSGTLHVVELAKVLNAKRLVYLSSIPIIGKPAELPITESHPINPLTVYHSTKYVGEQLIGGADSDTLSTVCLRIASPVGRDKRQKAFPERVIDCCKRDEDIVLYGKGGRIQNYIDVRDLAEAIRLALMNNDCRGLYLIKGGMTISNEELANSCIHYSDSQAKIIFSDKMDPEEDYKWIIDGTKAERELRYTPGYKPEDTIKWLLE